MGIGYFANLSISEQTAEQSHSLQKQRMTLKELSYKFKMLVFFLFLDSKSKWLSKIANINQKIMIIETILPNKEILKHIKIQKTIFGE